MKLRLSAAIGLSLLVALAALLPRQASGSRSEGIPGGIQLVVAPTSPGKPGLFDSKSGQPIVSASAPLAPGHSISGSVTITITGSAPEAVEVWQDHLMTSPANKPSLAAFATLTVLDTTTGKTAFSGTVSGFNAQASPLQLCGATAGRSSCPSWAAGESQVLVFTIGLPNIASENTYEQTTLTTAYEWSATVSGPNP